MLKRVGVSAAAGLLLGLGTIGLWSSLQRTNEEQVARIAEAESYAARSQLVRNVETMLTAMQNTRAYWSTFGHLPKDQWAADAGVELDHFKGIEMILWDDPDHNVRYARTKENPRFDYVPGDEEWHSYQKLLARARGASGYHLLGPFTSGTGAQTYEIVLAGVGSGNSGVLLALVDVDAMLGAFLADESPGFAVHVETGDVTIYERGEPARKAPQSWNRSGQIRLSFGPLWTVAHKPTDDMVETFKSPEIDLALLLGLVISALIATLIFENGRSKSRAMAAEIAETKIGELNRDLERQVRERTEELEQRNSDLQMLTDSVAHDLRNPLNSISVNTQLLEFVHSEKLGEDGMAVLRRVLPNVHQMLVVLDRLQGLSRIANSTFEREQIKMRDLVISIANDLKAAEPVPPIRIDVRDLPDVHADKKLVEILLVNLLGNAFKYTRHCESRRIIVDASVVGGETVYSVEDNGVGFDPGEAVVIFDAFVRLDKTSNQGAGLGLTLAKRVVLRHGGRIWAVGRPGEGAVFNFTLGPPETKGN
jgi:signal transduction histidine kinase